jgi:hypothetical protein
MVTAGPVPDREHATADNAHAFGELARRRRLVMLVVGGEDEIVRSWLLVGSPS